MEQDLSKKLEITRILIERDDGLPAKASVSSMEAADRVLGEWTNSAADSGRARCHFQIVFEDGSRYHSHYILDKSKKRVSLSRHVRNQITAMASAADDKPDIVVLGSDLDEWIRVALAHYNI